MYKLLITLLTLTISSFLIAQPVAYYPFNGNANDAINNNDGTVTGAFLTADRFGNANSAYLFDGIDDVIEIMDAPEFNFNQPITLAAWIMPLAPTSGGIISQWGSGGAAGDAFILLTNNSVLGTTVPPAPFLHLNASTSLTTFQWYFVAMTYNGDSIKLFENGSVVATDIKTGSNVDSYQPVKIGINDVNSFDKKYFNGIIDDVLIYNEALSESQVSDLYLNSIEINACNISTCSIHIDELIRLQPGEAPSIPTRGTIYYDDLEDKLKVWTGNLWESLH